MGRNLLAGQIDAVAATSAPGQIVTADVPMVGDPEWD